MPSGPGPEARCELTMPGLGGRLTLTYDTATLPVLQLWQDPRPQVRVLGLEPCTSERGPAARAVLLSCSRPARAATIASTLAFSAD